jgi:hypothetical protein
VRARFVTFKVKGDPYGEVTWQARCASGGQAPCGAESKVLGGEQAVVDWMAEHCNETGHARFERVFTDYALVERPQPMESKP